MKQPSSSSSNGHNGNGNGIGSDDVVIPKKPIQKVIPSRNTELMSSQKSTTATSSSQEASNSAHCLGYVKPHSPMKNGHGVLTQSNNNKFNTSNGSNGAASIAAAAAATGGGSAGLIKSPVSASSSKLGNAVKTHRTVTWNHDIPAEKLSFTMRREFDRQREETELMSQLRSVSIAN